MKLKLYYTQKKKLEKLAKTETDAAQLKRYRIILSRHRGLTYEAIYQLLGTAPSTIGRVLKHFMEEGIAGLRDRRLDKAAVKVTEAYIERLSTLIYDSPRDYGWQRSTWTRELLSHQLEEETGVTCHASHIGRLLAQLSFRWGRPKPGPKASTSPQGKAVKAGKLKALVANLGKDEVAVYQDEVDIHLNPKIGPCWMPRGKQFEVTTPGQNKKRYVFGGVNPNTGHVLWTTSARKNSAGFIGWLKALSRCYRRYRIIHVILDNYIIHKTKQVLATVKRMERIRLHFLPPYSPELNPIERLWGELHANVTRNHKHQTIACLMEAVETFMEQVVPYPGNQPSLA